MARAKCPRKIHRSTVDFNLSAGGLRVYPLNPHG